MREVVLNSKEITHYQKHSPSTLQRFLEIRRGERDGGPRHLQHRLALPFRPRKVYAWISEAKYDGVEIMMDERWDTHQEEYLRDLAEGHGVPILALHPPLRRGAWGWIPETLVRGREIGQ